MFPFLLPTKPLCHNDVTVVAEFKSNVLYYGVSGGQSNFEISQKSNSQQGARAWFFDRFLDLD